MTHGHVSYFEAKKDANLYQLNLTLKLLDESFEKGLIHSDEYVRKYTKLSCKLLQLQK